MYNEVIQTLAVTLGVAWASGINLYAAIFVLGFMQLNGYATLPPGLEVLGDPLVMAAAGLMYFIEFFADKTPGVDTGWDTIHTFIRIPAGAILAAGAAAEVAPAAELVAGILGGGVAAVTHATKAGGRVLINTSPEPVSNWIASLGEDLAVIAGLWTALNHPSVFLVLLVLFLLLVAWLLPKIWRGIKTLFAKLGQLFGRENRQASASVAPPPPSALGHQKREDPGAPGRQD